MSLDPTAVLVAVAAALSPISAVADSAPPQGAAAPGLSLTKIGPAAIRPLNLSRPSAAADPAYAQTLAWRAAGVVRTSVDHELSSGGVASLGFVCGLHPHPYAGGVTGARGVDPHGRFVGAKLAFALR
jgi:hypothetical protein